MKEKTACFTGHRNIPLFQTEKINKRLYKSIAELIAKGYCYFGAGGALGFDTLAALAVLQAKKKHPFIRLVMMIPCKDQDKLFSHKEKAVYRTLLEKADSVTFLQEKYDSGVMFRRNRALVDGSDLCVAFLQKLSGGTYQTVNYARKQGVKTVNILKYM